MNQMTRTGEVRPRKNGRPALAAVPGGESAALAQARQLDQAFRALARRVLIDDDPTFELPLGQIRVCMALFEEPRTMGQLSRELGVSQSAITQIADRLQASGLVTRLPDGADRRVRSLQLTPRARNMLRLREERRVRRVMEVLKTMPPGARRGVVASMAELERAAKRLIAERERAATPLARGSRG
jgi:DNA-binding MarR family transcriptional regulator